MGGVRRSVHFSCELLKGLDESKKVISRFRLLACKKCTCLTMKEKSEQFEQQKGKKMQIWRICERRLHNCPKTTMFTPWL